MIYTVSKHIRNRSSARNVKLMPWLSSVKYSLTHLPLIILFFEDVGGSMTFAMSLIALEPFVSSLLEIPTGVFSDKKGRRLTLILAALCDVLAVLFYILVALTWIPVYLLAIGAIIQGAGRALYNGTDNTLLYESLQDIGKSDDFAQAYGKSRSFWQLGILCVVIGSSAFGYIDILYGLMFVLASKSIALFLCMYLENPQTHKDLLKHKNNAFQHFKSGFLKLVRNRKMRLLTAISSIDHTSEAVTHSLQNPYFESLFSLWLVGIIRGLKHIFGAVGFYIAHKIIKKLGKLPAYTCAALLSGSLQITSVLFLGILGPFVMTTQNLLFAVTDTVETSFVQNELSNEERATMDSIYSFIRNMAFAFFSLTFGVVTDLFNIETALILLGMIKFLPLIFIRMLKKIDQEEKTTLAT